MKSRIAEFKLAALQGKKVIWVACLFVVAQLASRLHALEHAGHADETTQTETVRGLCVLAGGVDGNSTQTIASPNDTGRPQDAQPFPYLLIARDKLHAFVVRAPPVLTSFTEHDMS